MTIHWDLVAEAAGLAILLGATIALWWRGRREGLRDQPGWLAILAGLVSFSLGNAIDLADEAGLIPDPDEIAFGLAATLRDLVFPGLGVLLLAVGLLRWIPLPVRLEDSKQELAQANVQLEQRVEEATKELRSSEARLDHLLANAPAGIYTAEPDPPYATTFASESFADVYGVDLPSVLDDPAGWFDRVHPEDQERVDANMQALRTEEHLSQEYRFHGQDGALRWIRDDMQLIRDEDGNPVEIVGSALDITDRKRLEQELARRKEQLEMTIGTTDMILYSIDPDGVFTLSEGRGIERLGLEPGEVVGENVRDVYADHPEILDAFEEALEGELTRFETEVAGTCWESQFVPRVDEDGTVTAVDGVAVDVTARVEAERELREADELFETFAENLPAVLYMTGPQASDIRYVSPAAKDLIGLEPSQIIDDPASILDVVAPEDRDELAARLSGPPSTEVIDFRVEHPTEGLRWLRAATYPIHAGDRQAEAWVGIATDITAERRMLALQEESARVARELEQARELEVFKGRFLNMAAHELVTPLTPLRFQVDALQEGVVGEPSEEQLEALAVADRSVDRLEHLIANLVDATDLQAGDLQIEPMPADLLAIVEDGLDRAAQLHGEGLPLEPDLAGSVALVADANRLRRAVTSVVLEAAEHRKDRSDPVHVALKVDDERAHLTIEIFVAVLDAPGFEELFEPFEGVDDHEDVRAEGTGLGLFVARGVIEAHGGSIDASLDGGLQFRIGIPLGDQVEQ